MRTLVTCSEHPACQYEIEAGVHHQADPQPDSPSEVAIRARMVQAEAPEANTDRLTGRAERKHRGLRRIFRRKKK